MKKKNSVKVIIYTYTFLE